jgi:hypothetical protein
MANDFYTYCTCPACKTKLDATPTTAKWCPQCRGKLDPHDVWSTRKYPGQLILPRWITAFGWPLLFMLIGAGATAGTYFASGGRRVMAPVGLFAVGMIWFFVKLSGADDD